jgi:uncharacterized membrane protein HdeD (DUF308 family)
MPDGSPHSPSGRRVDAAGDEMDIRREESAAWGGPFLVGLLLVVTGIACIVSAYAAGLASVVLFGGFMVVAGVLELVSGARAPDRRARPWIWLGGLLSIVVGVMLLARPVNGLVSLTLLLACYFFANGLFRAITSAADRYPGWGGDFLYGIVTLLLGLMIVRTWPLSSLWLAGTLVGVEILMRGLTLMSAGLFIRRLVHADSTA